MNKRKSLYKYTWIQSNKIFMRKNTRRKSIVEYLFNVFLWFSLSLTLQFRRKFLIDYDMNVHRTIILIVNTISSVFLLNYVFSENQWNFSRSLIGRWTRLNEKMMGLAVRIIFSLFLSFFSLFSFLVKRRKWATNSHWSSSEDRENRLVPHLYRL